MDPFTGLGSTAVACARLGLGFIGADVDESYLNAAIDRVQDAGKPRMAKAGLSAGRAGEAKRVGAAGKAG
jgi:DNA modification methylase